MGSKDAIISISNIGDMFKVIKGDCRFVDIVSIGLDKVIIDIIYGYDPIYFAPALQHVESILSKKGIERLVLACTELCMIQYENRINKVNLLDVLIDKTIDALTNNSFD